MKKILGIINTFFIVLTLTSCLENFNPSLPSGENITDYKSSNLKLWYDEETPKIKEGNSEGWMTGGSLYNDDGWTKWSLPLGNGYFGVNVFGRTDSERIQITDKTLSNPWLINGEQKGGLNNFSETYIDFGHQNAHISGYKRTLDIENAISEVEYTYRGIKYRREYFASYPDNALVIYLEADGSNKLDFTLRPTIPYEQSYMIKPNDNASKIGEVVSWVDNNIGVVELSGTLEYYDVDFYGLYHVYTDGGNISAKTCEHTYKDKDGEEYTDIDGTIVVEGANRAFIVVNIGTDYELSSETFTTDDKMKPTFNTSIEDAAVKVTDYYLSIESIINNKNFKDSYEILRERHLEDYRNIFTRVSLDLNANEEDLIVTTDVLLNRYMLGKESRYLETLLFQYGRYLLIASSRSGTLPANLQGTWNTYNTPPWSSGYWHNINVQMNYWHAFTTNISETFDAYIEFNEAYMAQAEKNASTEVGIYNKEIYGKDGGNGWTIGVAGNPFFINSDRSPGNMGFVTQLYWDYYQYTLDEDALQQAYKVLANAARYVTKCVKEDENGNFLVMHCDSPEQYVNGVWYYTTGTTYAQTFAYLNNYYVLQLAKNLDINIDDADVLSNDEYSILKTILSQLDKYDPINVGLSGQIKEFREEDYYGSLGDPNHRHISQLVGLYPGNLINSTTSAWLDAAKVTLDGRGDFNQKYAWVYAHKMNLYARVKDGDSAYNELKSLISKCLFQNLWTSYDEIYQAEGNFGTTAGIAEMLLQSHEGYIEPLAALPNNWNEGSYSGLVAQGNFEIGVTWSNSLASKITIKSNKGLTAKVYYPSITSSKVIDSKGNIISYEVIDKNLISFETVEGEIYTISEFEKIDKLDKVTNFKFTREHLGNYYFTWDKDLKAKSYNIYKAVDNDSNYTLITSTPNNNYIYIPPITEDNVRTTFCITAVDENGNESERTLTYFNPLNLYASIEDVSWQLIDNKLNVNINASSMASKYRLYEKNKNSEEYKLILESDNPSILYENYNNDNLYAISTVSSYDNLESSLYILKDYNILKGKRFIPTEEANSYIYDNTYAYLNLTDGIFAEFEGRFSTKINNSLADATVDLDGIYVISELRIYDYAQDIKYVGKDLIIEVYYNGTWHKVINCNSNSSIDKYRSNEGNLKYLSFNLEGNKAEKIRFAISGTLNDYSISFYEIECYGYQAGDTNSLTNVFENKQFSPNGNALDYVYNDNYSYNTLTDCIFSEFCGRFSTKINDSFFDGIIDLGKIHALSEIRIYDYNQDVSYMGTDLLIEVYLNGTWHCVVNCETNEEINTYRVSNGVGAGNGYISFNLENIEAEKLRIYISNTLLNKSISIYEIECFGTVK